MPTNNNNKTIGSMLGYSAADLAQPKKIKTIDEIQNQKNLINNQYLKTPETIDTSEVRKEYTKKENPNTLKRIWNTINDIPASVSYGALKGLEGIVDLVASVAGGIGGMFGADKFKENVSNFVSKDYAKKIEDKITKVNTFGSTDSFDELYETSYINDAPKWFGKIVREVPQAIGQMTPAIATSIATGGTSLVTTAGQQAATWAPNVLSNATFFATAAGNSMEQALNEGATLDDATSYGLASGLLETAVEQISGGIGGIGSGLFEKALPNVAAKIASKPLFKIATTFLGEGLEEVASELIDPYLKRMTYDEDAPLATFEDCFNSFVTGGLAGVIMGSFSFVEARREEKIMSMFESYDEAMKINDQIVEAMENKEYEKADKLTKQSLKLFDKFENTLKSLNVNINSAKVVNNSGKNQSNTIDNNSNMTYNESEVRNENGEVNRNGITDGFRKLQEESRRITSEEQQLFNSGSQRIDEDLRNRLSGIFTNEINSRRNINGNGNAPVISSENFQVSNVDGNLFHDIFEINKKYLKYGELVDLHDNYDDANCYLSEDGLSGFAITKNGDLFSVFNLSDKRGFLKSISEFVKNNAKTLDCYMSENQPLNSMYEKFFGFKTASIMDYNMDFDHDDIAKNHNMPQVAFMVNTNQDVITKQFNKDQYDEAVNYRQSYLQNNTNQKKKTKNTTNNQASLTATNTNTATATLNTQTNTNTNTNQNVNNVNNVNNQQQNNQKQTKKKNTKQQQNVNNNQNNNNNVNNNQNTNTSTDYVTDYNDTIKKRGELRKVDTKRILDKIITDIETNGKLTVKGGEKVFYNVLHSKFNNQTAIKSTVSREVADYIYGYVAAKNGTTLSGNQKTQLIQDIQSVVEEVYNQNGNNISENALGKIVNQTEKNFNNLVKTSSKIVNQIKEVNDFYSREKLTDSLGAEEISNEVNAALKGIVGSNIDKNNIRNSKTREAFITFADQVFNPSNPLLAPFITPQVQADINYLKANQGSNALLSIEELKSISNILSSLIKLTKQNGINEITLTNGSKAKIDDLAASGVTRVSKIKNKIKSIFNSIKSFGREIIKPRLLFNQLDGTVSGEADGMFTNMLYNEMDNANTEYLTYTYSLLDPFEDFMKQNKNYDKKLQNENVTIKTSQGDITVAKGTAIYIYELSKRDQARGHFMTEFLDGRETKKPQGLTIMDKGDKALYRNIVMSDSDIQELYKSFDQEDKSFIKLTEKFFNEDASAIKKEGDMKYLGYEDILDDFYIPIISDSSYRFYFYGDEQKTRSIESIFGAYFNKPTIKNANSPISVNNIMNVINRHAETVSKYAAFIVPVTNIRKVFNRKVVTNGDFKTNISMEMDKKWGQGKFEKYVNDYILDAISLNVSQGADKIYDNMRSLYASAKLGLNFKSVAYQWTVILESLPEIGGSNILQGMKLRANREALFRYSPYLRNRMQNSTIVMAESTTKNKVNGVRQKMVALTQAADNATIDWIYKSFQVKVEKEKGFKIGTEQNLEEAAKLTERNVKNKQGFNSLERVGIARSNNGLIKALNMFRAQTQASFNNIIQAPLEIVTLRERLKEYNQNLAQATTQAEKNQILSKIDLTKKQINSKIKAGIKSFSSFALSNLALVSIATFFRWLLGKLKDKDEVEILKEVGSNWMENVVDLIPVFGQFVNNASQGYDTKEPVLTMVGEAANSFYSLLSNPSADNLKTALRMSGEATGFPVNNFIDYSTLAINTFSPSTAYKYNSLFYSTSYSKHIQNLEDALEKNQSSRADAILQIVLNDITSKSTQAIRNEELRLLKLGYSSVLPKRAPSDDSVDKDKFKKAYSEVNSYLDNMVNQSYYKQLTDENKAKAIKRLYSAFYEYARQSTDKSFVSNNKYLLNKNVIPINQFIVLELLLKQQDKNNKSSFLHSLAISDKAKSLLS